MARLAPVPAAWPSASLQVIAGALEHGDKLEELLVVEAHHQATLDKGDIDHLLIRIVRDHVKVVLVHVVALLRHLCHATPPSQRSAISQVLADRRPLMAHISSLTRCAASCTLATG